MKQSFVALFFLALCVAWSGSAFAQMAPAPSSGASSASSAAPQAAVMVKDPVASSLRMLLPRSRTNVLGTVTAMPADKFNYKPTPDQITFAHLVVHITESNNAGCSRAASVPAPKIEELRESDSKEKLLAAVTASYDFCTDALSKMDDSKLGEEVEMFGGRKFPRAMAALGLASGWADHYAAAAQYLRLNGITPPSAQPKK